MLEEVGLAIRNSWLHDQLAANHAMIADILEPPRQRLRRRRRQSGHAARQRRRRAVLPARRDRTARELEFTDLPQQLGSMVFTVHQNRHGHPAVQAQACRTRRTIAYRRQYHALPHADCSGNKCRAAH